MHNWDVDEIVFGWIVVSIRHFMPQFRTYTEWSLTIIHLALS